LDLVYFFIISLNVYCKQHIIFLESFGLLNYLVVIIVEKETTNIYFKRYLTIREIENFLKEKEYVTAEL